MKKLLPAAVLAALTGVNGAQAVHVNSDGLGQVLIYPFYTTEDGQDTYINLVNTTDDFKAVKVRILESMNSQEVLDFNLYLSPRDHWSALITADENGGTITSADTSCTVPLAISNGDTIPFREFEYADDSINGTERTGEGYVEVIEMATIEIGSQNWPFDIEHVNGVPSDCPDLDAAWLPGGAWDVNPQDGTSDPTGGLYGYGVLINVDEGTDATYDAVAFDNFFDPITGVVHTNPGSLDPSLNNSTADYDVIDGNVVTSDTADDGLDAVSATIMHNTISNDYVLEPSISAGTDWVMTFPTKRDYVAVTPAEDPFLTPWDEDTSSSCEEFNIVYWDREEGTPTAPPGSNDFSPRPPGTPDVPFALCYEANVMTFNGSNVLSASTRTGTNFSLEDGFNNGWAEMNFVTATRQPLIAGGSQFEGLPVIGFAVQKYVNGDIGGLLSNYAGSVTHKATRLIGAAPAPAPAPTP